MYLNVEDCIDNDELLAKRILYGLASILSKKQRRTKNESRKTVVRLTESELRKVIQESISMVLNENLTSEEFDRIDDMLEKYGDVCVFRFYSDLDDLTISANKDVMQQKDAIVNDMKRFGYILYTVNSDGDYIMLEFKRD